MHKNKQNLYKIGDLSRLSGVSIDTIRYYSNTGVLPASSRTEAGFRLYTNTDRARLELIRTLRELGFSLPAISELLQNEISASAALRLQLNAIREGRCRLQRQETLLKAALQQGEEGALAYLNRTQVLINLDAAGRERFMDEHLGRIIEGATGPLNWKKHLWSETVFDLPEEINGEQFEAWLELADLMLNESFLQYFNELMRSFWKDLSWRGGIGSWFQNFNQMLAEVLEAALQGELPQGRLGQTLLQRYINLYATFTNRVGDPTLLNDLLNLLEQLDDPRVERYWELVGILKGLPIPTMWHRYQAQRWLAEALKWWVARPT